MVSTPTWASSPISMVARGRDRPSNSASTSSVKVVRLNLPAKAPQFRASSMAGRAARSSDSEGGDEPL